MTDEEKDNQKRLIASQIALDLFNAKNLPQIELLFDQISFFYNELSKQQEKSGSN